MKHRKGILRVAVATLFSLSMAFGATQVFAGSGSENNGDQAACDAWQCRAECGSLGGELGPGGPGKPLQCYCCG